MKLRVLAMCVAVVCLPVGIVSCGSDDGGGSGSADKPSVDEISRKIQESDGADAEQADCMARVFHDNLDAEALNATMALDDGASIDDSLSQDLTAEQLATISTGMGQCFGLEPADLDGG